MVHMRDFGTEAFRGAPVSELYWTLETKFHRFYRRKERGVCSFSGSVFDVMCNDVKALFHIRKSCACRVGGSII